MNPYEDILSPSTVGGLHELWAASTGGRIVFSSAAVVDGAAYITSLDGNLYSFDAAIGTQLWSHDAGEPLDSSPAVVNGLVYFTTTNHLVALDAGAGSVVWDDQVVPGQIGLPSPTVHQGVIYQPVDQTLQAFDAATGALLWTSQQMNAKPASTATVKAGRIFVTTGARIYAFAATTGTLLWSRRVLSNGDVFNLSTPGATAETVYATSEGGNVFALSTRNGRIEWKTSLQGAVIDSSPAVSSTTLYVADHSGNRTFALERRHWRDHLDGLRRRERRFGHPGERGRLFVVLGRERLRLRRRYRRCPVGQPVPRIPCRFVANRDQ